MTEQIAAGPGIPLGGDYEGRARAAVSSMEGLRLGLEAHLERLRELAEGDAAALMGFDPKAVMEAAKSVAKALGLATELEGKAAYVRRIDQGGDGLDLDAARAEVGRRLARLRDAGGPDGVPGLAE